MVSVEKAQSGVSQGRISEWQDTATNCLSDRRTPLATAALVNLGNFSINHRCKLVEDNHRI